MVIHEKSIPYFRGFVNTCSQNYGEKLFSLFRSSLRGAQGPAGAVADYLRCAEAARDAGLGLNAGHDLNLENLEYFIRTIPWTDEVSIGHALISDALYMGLEKTIAAYLSKIKIF